LLVLFLNAAWRASIGLLVQQIPDEDEIFLGRICYTDKGVKKLAQ
jgi:hypothetical protein